MDWHREAWAGLQQKQFAEKSWLAPSRNNSSQYVSKSAQVQALAGPLLGGMKVTLTRSGMGRAWASSQWQRSSSHCTQPWEHSVPKPPVGRVGPLGGQRYPPEGHQTGKDERQRERDSRTRKERQKLRAGERGRGGGGEDR